MERARSRIDTDRVARADVRGEFRFKGRHFVAENELAAVQHAGDRLVDVVFDGRILSAKIEKRNHAAHPMTSSSTIRPRIAIDCVAASSTRTTRRPAVPSVSVGWRASTH